MIGKIQLEINGPIRLDFTNDGLDIDLKKKTEDAINQMDLPKGLYCVEVDQAYISGAKGKIRRKTNRYVCKVAQKNVDPNSFYYNKPFCFLSHYPSIIPYPEGTT